MKGCERNEERNELFSRQYLLDSIYAGKISKCPIVLKPALAVPPSKYPDIVNKTSVVYIYTACHDRTSVWSLTET